jgi:hypothetical protein
MLDQKNTLMLIIINTNKYKENGRESLLGTLDARTKFEISILSFNYF